MANGQSNFPRKISTMNKLGFLLPHLGSSQAAFYTINTANIMFGQPDIDITIFYKELFQPCSKPLCASMNAAEIWGFDGVLISTDIDTTLMSLNAVAPKRRLFYIWDLEWTHAGKNDFIYNMQAFRNPRVELVARSNSHAYVIDNYANRPVNAIIPDFNIHYILDYLERTNESAK